MIDIDQEVKDAEEDVRDYQDALRSDHKAKEQIKKDLEADKIRLQEAVKNLEKLYAIRDRQRE